MRLTEVAGGFTQPVDILFAPGDATRMFVVEQPGRVRIVRDGLVVPAPFIDVSNRTAANDERGPLGMAFHPQYATNRRFFVYYTRNTDGALIVERYERAIDNAERADAASGRVLFTIPHPGATNHNGGKLAFGPDGYLWIGTGDGDGATNLAEWLAGTSPLDAQDTPAGSPFAAPEITSRNALTCVVGAACSLTIAATGVPTPSVARTGTLPTGLTCNASTRTIADTPAAGAQGIYAQSVGAGNGTLSDAAQTLNVLVVDACGGFADVASTDRHCNAVEWMRNRAVTIGCTGNLYCSSLAVIRASMALFQQRLGGVPSPVLGYTEAAGGALALATQEIVCASADLPAASHPRDVKVRYALSTQSTGALTLGITVVASGNGGATWEPATQTRMRAQTAAAQWRSTSGVALASVAAGEAVRFGLALDREAGAASLGATNCRLATMAVNRNASAPPRDVGVVLAP